MVQIGHKTDNSNLNTVLPEKIKRDHLLCDLFYIADTKPDKFNKKKENYIKMLLMNTGKNILNKILVNLTIC